MIRQHDFNSKWWGKPVGFTDDPEFFELPLSQQKELLAPFHWAEFRCAEDLSPQVLSRSGFFYIDNQIHFRIGLAGISHSPSLDHFEICPGDSSDFSLEEQNSAHFQHERFRHIPGMTLEKLRQRYILWANDLIKEHGKWCLQIMHQGKVQGWFLSQAQGKKLNLTLAMLSSEASISGMSLYHKALWHYRQMSKIGWACFSIENLAVLNIYAHLGARFSKTEQCWLWYPEK